MAYTYEHPRPSVTVDCVILKIISDSIQILLIQREKEPFKNKWALPGGFLEMEEKLVEGVKRELEEETGLKISKLEQIGAFGDPDRDPRGRVISIAFLSILKKRQESQIKAASDAADVQWFDLQKLPELAFDHKKIISKSITYLRNQLKLSLVEQQPFFDLSEKESKEINNLITGFHG
ncbi:hypothetical protein BH23BAC1_BH23BAC1_41600 [soil metagenome]